MVIVIETCFCRLNASHLQITFYRPLAFGTDSQNALFDCKPIACCFVCPKAV